MRGFNVTILRTVSHDDYLNKVKSVNDKETLNIIIIIKSGILYENEVNCQSTAKVVTIRAIYEKAVKSNYSKYSLKRSNLIV